MSYQSCVEGHDFVVRDSSGKEYSRCVTDYEAITPGVTGADKNDCATKHAQSKVNFCKNAPATSAGSGDTNTNNNTGGTTQKGTSYCYKKKDNSLCDCQHVASGYDSTWEKVDSCSATAGLVEPSCCTYGSAPYTSCNCKSKASACREKGSSCSCPESDNFNNMTRGNLDQVVASCGKTGNRICCTSDSYCACGNEQYSGAGCIGYGGVDESPVPTTSCTAPGKPFKACGDTGTERTSCDGLAWDN